ncbi:MAG: maleylpyruvate isomerase N-terminal domain-containing protein [Acidimicrobiales bacterium]
MDCNGCDFAFGEVRVEQLGDRLRSSARKYSSILTSHDAEELGSRPKPAVWSPLEYSCHLRDVLWNIRDRILLALVEDHPTFAPIHREERVILARYGDEMPTSVATGITAGADLLAWLIEGLDQAQMSRTGVYAGVDRDGLWMGRQALHEAVHHLQDVNAGLGTAGARAD